MVKRLLLIAVLVAPFMVNAKTSNIRFLVGLGFNTIDGKIDVKVDDTTRFLTAYQKIKEKNALGMDVSMILGLNMSDQVELGLELFHVNFGSVTHTLVASRASSSNASSKLDKDYVIDLEDAEIKSYGWAIFLGIKVSEDRAFMIIPYAKVGYHYAQVELMKSEVNWTEANLPAAGTPLAGTDTLEEESITKTGLMIGGGVNLQKANGVVIGFEYTQSALSFPKRAQDNITLWGEGKKADGKEKSSTATIYRLAVRFGYAF